VEVSDHRGLVQTTRGHATSPQRRTADLRWLLHDDEAGAIEIMRCALSSDGGDVFACAVDSPLRSANATASARSRGSAGVGRVLRRDADGWATLDVWSFWCNPAKLGYIALSAEATMQPLLSALSALLRALFVIAVFLAAAQAEQLGYF
jgi:hypothetical protein